MPRAAWRDVLLDYHECCPKRIAQLPCSLWIRTYWLHLPSARTQRASGPSSRRWRCGGIPAWPPTAIAWKALAATLKLGGYSSAAIYFSTYRATTEQLGFCLDDLAIRSIKDYTRSCLRGMGAPCAGSPSSLRPTCISSWWSCAMVRLRPS